MRADDLLELAALDAAGALDDDERTRLTRALASADEATRRDAAAFYDAALAVPPEEGDAPSAAVRERVLAHARATVFRFVAAADEWRAHQIPGARFKLLSADEATGRATLLLEVPAGAVYPAHEHTGAEDCYVVSGDVFVEGRRLGPGDFHHAAAGSRHAPLSSQHGATVLLVVSLADYR